MVKWNSDEISPSELIQAYENAEQYQEGKLPDLKAADLYIGFAMALEEAQDMGVIDEITRKRILKRSAKFAAHALTTKRRAKEASMPGGGN